MGQEASQPPIPQEALLLLVPASQRQSARCCWEQQGWDLCCLGPDGPEGRPMSSRSRGQGAQGGGEQAPVTQHGGGQAGLWRWARTAPRKPSSARGLLERSPRPVGKGLGSNPFLQCVLQTLKPRQEPVCPLGRPRSEGWQQGRRPPLSTTQGGPPAWDTPQARGGSG